jgi:DNA-binding IclR family transcriptional regulator
MIPNSIKNNAIEKALKILSTFIPYNQESSTTEISRKLGFHKATVSRILLTLTEHGFLEQCDQTKKFKLGPVVMNLGMAVRRSLKNDLVHIAKPFIDELRDELKESVLLEILAKDHTIIAYIAEGPGRVRLAGTIGDYLPIHVAAGAKAILAFSSPEVKNLFLNKKMPRLTPHTITDPEVLDRQFREIKKCGVSFDQEEHDLDINAIGAPVFNGEKFPVAAVVVAGPKTRVICHMDSAIAAQLKKTAAKISERLYYEKEHDA